MKSDRCAFEEVLATVEPLVARRLRRRGLAGDDASDGWAEEAPVFAELAAASIDGIAVLGAGRGARPTTIDAAMGSVCMPRWSSRPANGIGSNASAGTCYVRPSRSIACT